MTHSNIGHIDRIARYLAGGVLLTGVLLLAFSPALAIVAAYLVLTAIIGWEPIYAFLTSLNTVSGRRVKKVAARSAHARLPAHG
jgi:hypothetical protein